MSAVDAVIVGSSPNALAAAARLAKSGRRVVVVEPSDRIGGPVATEEIAPGFFADTGVMSAALDPEVASDLGVQLDVVRRETITSLAGETVTLRRGDALPKSFDDASDVLRAIYAIAPPLVPSLSARDAASLEAIAARLTGLGARRMHEVLRLSFMSVRDYFAEHSTPAGPHALLAAASLRGLSEGPFAQGTLFGLLHHEAIGDGLVRCNVRGGLGKIAEALAAAARSAGADIRTGIGAVAIDVEGGAARGVKLADGSRIEASIVISDLDARATFTKLVAPPELEPEENRALRAIRYRGAVARVHLCLSGLPEFRGLSRDLLRGTIAIGASSVASLERAWDHAKRGAVPDEPYIEIAIPTIDDPTRAPDGKHVLEAWVQHVPYGRADRAKLLEKVVDRIVAWSPDLRRLIVHAQASLPEDLERRFGLTEGHLYGGEVRLNQAFFLRPVPGYARYRTPIENLHLGGSAAHPGGYSGRSGWNLAGTLIDASALRGSVTYHGDIVEPIG